jgi:hypothetical protein
MLTLSVPAIFPPIVPGLFWRILHIKYCARFDQKQVFSLKSLNLEKNRHVSHHRYPDTGLYVQYLHDDRDSLSFSEMRDLNACTENEFIFIFLHPRYQAPRLPPFFFQGGIPHRLPPTAVRMNHERLPRHCVHRATSSMTSRDQTWHILNIASSFSATLLWPTFAVFDSSSGLRNHK